MVRRGILQLRDVLGTALMLEGESREGSQLLERSIATGRAGALQYNAVAAARWEMGNSAGAVEALEHAIRMEPTLESSYVMLATLYGDSGRTAGQRSVWDRLLAHRPRLIGVRMAARRLSPERGR